MKLSELRKIVEECNPKATAGKRRWTAFSRGGVLYVRQNYATSRHIEMDRQRMESSLNRAGVKGKAVRAEMEYTVYYTPYIEFTVEQ